MIVSNNEDENDNCPRLLFEEMRYIKQNLSCFGGKLFGSKTNINIKIYTR